MDAKWCSLLLQASQDAAFAGRIVGAVQMQALICCGFLCKPCVCVGAGVSTISIRTLLAGSGKWRVLAESLSTGAFQP